MGRIMSQPLDRERPLWETWLVEGLEGGHWALIPKVHHCMVDGIAGVELLGVLLDLEADTKVGVPGAMGARAGASRRGKGARRVGWPRHRCHRHRTRASPSHHPPGRHHPLRRPGPPGALPALPATSGRHHQLSIEGSIGPHRTWAHSSASLADVRTIRSVFGGTINDVVLAAVSGGYPGAAPLTRRGRRPSTCPLLGAGVDAARRRPSQNRQSGFGPSLRPAGSGR